MRNLFIAAVGILSLLTSSSALEPGRFYTHGPRDKEAIALSFDDGPGPYTERILAVLEKHGAKATFFMQGNQVSWRKPLAKKVAEAGHEISAHLWNHVNYKFRLRDLAKEMNEAAAEAKLVEELEEDMRKTTSQIEGATGVKPTLLRMPHGIDRPWVYPAAKKFGLTVVNWTYGADWTSVSSEKMAEGYVKAIEPGAILLFHDGGGNRAKTVDVLEAVLAAVKEKGYAIQPVGVLLQEK